MSVSPSTPVDMSQHTHLLNVYRLLAHDRERASCPGGRYVKSDIEFDHESSVLICSDAHRVVMVYRC